MTTTVERRAARVLLNRGEGRVLLFRGHDPHRPDQGSWWFTVGGGVDEGETMRDAAVRELFEESGLVMAGDDRAGPVHAASAEFSIADTFYRQDNEFYVARVPSHDVVTGGVTPLGGAFVPEPRRGAPARR